MPGPSYFPFVAAVGLTTAGYGLILTTKGDFGFVIGGIGILLLLLGTYAWALEPVAEDQPGAAAH